MLAAVSLGIGMSLATSVMVMLDTLLLREPFPGASHVLQVYELDNQASGGFQPWIPARHVEALASRNLFLSGVAVAEPTSDAILGTSGAASQEPATRVSSNFFETVGVRPILGRGFLPTLASRGDEPSVIIGYTVWQSRFGESRDITTKTIRVDGKEARIVGVMPKGFTYPGATRVWLLLGETVVPAMAHDPKWGQSWSRFEVFGRLASGATAADAVGALESAIKTADRLAGVHQQTRVQVLSIPDGIRRANRTQVELWLCLAALLVCLCAVNFATVTLARGMRRRAELALRSALGASPAQIVGALLVDALLLAAIAGIIAVVLSVWISGFVQTSFGADVQPAAIAFGWRTVLAGLPGSVIVGVLFTLAPSIELARADLRQYLTTESGVSDSAGRLSRARTGLVALQIALATVCVVSIVALVKADRRFDWLGPGYDYIGVLTANVLASDSTARANLDHDLLEFVRSRPQVIGASLERSPIGSFGALEVSPDTRPSLVAGLGWIDADPDLYATLRVKAVAGRLPTSDEVRARAPIAVLTRSAAQIFGKVNPIGHRIRINALGQRRVWLSVIGIIPDVQRGPDFSWTGAFTVYTCLALPENYSDGTVLGAPRTDTRLFLRVSGDPPANVLAMRRALMASDNRVVVNGLRTVSSDVEQFNARSRGRHLFLAGIAALAIALAAVGVYGLTSFTAHAKSKEINIRLALGARPRDITRVILGDLVTLSVVGAAGGVLLSGRVAEMLDATLRGPLDDLGGALAFSPLARIVTATGFLVLAVLAAYRPVRRAVHQDIARGLR